MTRHTDDELLSAYLDDELDEAAADALTERLAREPALMQRLESMRSADSAVRDVYRDIDSRPLPDGVLGLFGAAGTAKEAARDNVVAFPRTGIRRYFEAPVAIAASVALVVGILAAGFFDRSTPMSAGGLVAGTLTGNSDLRNVLDGTPSGETVTLGNGADATVVLSFEDTRGAYCRQLTVTTPTQSTHGLACRRDGGWQVETIALGEAGSGAYGQASSAVPAALRAAVDERIGDGEPLDADQEKRVISEAWGNSSK